jgi:oligogalacturonide transport system permease protein
MREQNIASEKAKKNRKRKSARQYIGLLYIAPWLIGFVVFQLYPLIASFYYSLTDYNLITEAKFVGLKNYIRMFTSDEIFIHSLKITFKYVLISLPLKLITALMVALILNTKIRGVNIYRTVYYLPSIFGGSVAISVIWRFLFMREGLVNLLMSYLGIPAVDWLGNPNISLVTISFINVWMFGSSMVLFLAGLKQIPNELYEAARVDGCSKIRMFFKITLPMLTPIILFNVIMQSIGMFQEFTAPFVITKGGPLKSTYVFGLLLYENAFAFYKMGYASALSWVLFIILTCITFALFKSSSYWVHYSDGGDF